jgi:surfactin synthase thioesterase subunit
MPSTPHDTSLWFRNFAPSPGAATRLVCLPHAGGSASSYLAMARGLAPDVDVVAAQYPGRQDRRREPCRTTVADLADELAEAVTGWCDRPLALFGHSMGATLAFELARRLERRPDVELVRVFASGRRAPSVPHDDGVHLLDDAGVLRELARLDGTTAALLQDEEIMRAAMPAIRADYRAAETYRFDGGEPLQTPLVVLTGDADPKTPVEQARAWAGHTTGGCAVHVYRGGHFFLSDHVPAVLALVRHELAARQVARSLA